MQCLRLIIMQNSANYRKEETMYNKMTYPLPQVSTVIGALHSVCGYREYRPMDISIQGRFSSMNLRPYTDYCFLNSVMDDRGMLVKMKNQNLLSSSFIKVAKAKKSQGNSFRKGITIDVFDKELMEEYIRLRDLGDEIKEFKDKRIKHLKALIKKRKKRLSSKKKLLDKKSEDYKRVLARENEIKALEKLVDTKLKEYELKNFTEPLSKYKSLTTSLKYYEILSDVELIIHIRSDEQTLNDILENVYNIKAIGRSEDFVDIVDARLVELYEGECNAMSEYSAYLSLDDVRSGRIYPKVRIGQPINGTKYYISKNYSYGGKDNKQRIFEKVKVLYTSNYSIEKTSENIFLDKSDGKDYIVNFL